jgi:DNA-binding IclR family transcriptional regulator
MSATGRNIMKMIVGTAIGAAIAKAIASKEEREDIPDDERVPLTATVKDAPVRLRERWEQAKDAGIAAEEASITQLTEIFRSKVSDPDALKAPRPPSR